MSDKDKQAEEFDKCPECGKSGKFIPPNHVEGKTLIVKFECPNGHKFSKRTPLK